MCAAKGGEGFPGGEWFAWWEQPAGGSDRWTKHLLAADQPGATNIHPVDVNGEYVVDNGYAVAWEPSLTYRLTRGKKIRSFLFSDQLLLRFSGQGRIWLQSRSPRSLANWVHPFRRVESKND